MTVGMIVSAMRDTISSNEDSKPRFCTGRGAGDRTISPAHEVSNSNLHALLFDRPRDSPERQR